MSGRFTGRTLVATGGGSGLARATARRFTSDGGRVAIIDLDGARAQAVADELDGAIALAADVADERAVQQAIGSVAAEFGRIDCLFNAAGIADFGPIAEWDLQRFERMLRIHVAGTFMVTREVVPHMHEHGGGAIVNVASVAALVAQPFNAPYGAAKGAIISYSRQLAMEFAPTIRVNTIAPGRVRTGMTEPLYTSRGGGSWEQGAIMAGENNLQKRVGDADEIAGPACFLLSEDASFITGQVLVADGGETVF